MGSIFCPRKPKSSEIMCYEKFINGINKTFKSKEEFNLSMNKTKSYQLYEQVSKTEDFNEKMKLYNEILKLNNYDENIIYNYLLLLKNNENNKSESNKSNRSNEKNKNDIDKEYKDELNEYSVCLSNENYYKLENTEKKPCAKDNLLELFEILNEFDFDDTQKRFYFYEYLKREPKNYEIKINFSEKENQELYLYFLFYDIFCIFQKELNKYSKKVFESQKTFNEKLDEFVNDGSKKIILKFDDFMKTNVTLILFSEFFDALNIVSDFVKNNINFIRDILNKKIIDIYCLEGIILIMKSQIQYCINSDNSIDKLFKNYYNDECDDLNIESLNKNFKNIEIIINDKNLKIVSKSNNNSNCFIINNYYMYHNLEEPLKYIDKYFNFTNNISVKFYLIDYIKLQYFQLNNYVQYSLPFIQKFHNKISNSKTIYSLINYLFPGYKEEDFLSNNFILSIFDNILNGAKFYPFKNNLYSITFYHSLNIDFQISNKTYLIGRENNLYKTFYKYIILNLGFFIICEYHESLGHYLREYLRLLTLIDYESQRDDNGKKESGSYIQYLLLDNKIEFSLYELIFILDYNNYNVDFREFKKNFTNLKENKYEPSNDLKKDLIEFFDIDYNNIKNKIEKEFKESKNYKLFGDLKNLNSVEKYKFEMYKSCSINTRDIYIENKKFEAINNEIYQELKNIISLYQQKIKK